MAIVDSPVGVSREAVERLSALRKEPEWMREKRLHAWQVFESLPMPTRKDEEWRRTDISKLRLDRLVPYTAAEGAGIQSPLRLDGDAAGRLSHVNSETVDCSLSKEVSDRGVIFTDLDTAVRDHPDLVRKYFMTEAVPAEYNKFAALNGALWSGGTFLYVPKDVILDMPLHAFSSLTAGGASIFTHTLVIVGQNANVSFVEEYASPDISGQALNAGVVEMFLAQNSRLNVVTLQEWMGDVLDISVLRALVDRDSRLDWLVVGVGNGVTKANIEARLRGVGATAQMLGVLWGYGKQHTDYHTVQDHAGPHTTSDLLYKAALADEAKSIFSGRIRVEKGAQGTDAYQTNRSLLLSPNASAFPSPNLEIEANEVRCSHGASVGQVDQDQLFYLMARGIPKDQATRMIVEGFFTDVLAREMVTSVREHLAELIVRKMDERL
jgi:Fe-S cluster assembly protein SufD